MANNYIAFISYRHLPLDTAVAEKLHKSIERYRVPKELRKSAGQKYLGRVFRDKEELPLSNDLTQDIYEALDASEFLIVVCTPQTPESLWVDREIEHFLTKHDRDHIITVLAAGTAEESIPRRITEVYGPDGVTVVDRREPLCAWLVDSNERKILRNLNKEFLRLVAAILEKPYDSIRQRQKLYRQRRILAACGAVAAVSLCFVGMLASKNRRITEQNETIQAQNQQIEDQLNQTLLNESEALTLLSGIRLEDGDRMDALACALSALPSEDNPRPYYAQAKVALEEALYLYETGYRADRMLEGWMEYRVLSEDGRYLLAGTIRSTVACWDLSTGEILWEYPMDEYAVMTLEFALEQNAAVYVSCSGSHYVLDLDDGSLRCQYTFSKREQPADFSPDGRWMAVTDDDTLYLCSLERQETLQSVAVEGGSSIHGCVGRFNAAGDRFVMICEDDYGQGLVLHASVFNTETMKLVNSFDLAQLPGSGKWDLDILALEDGCWQVLWFDGEDSRYACRISEKGILTRARLDAPGEAGDRYSAITSQVCLVGDQVRMAFPDRIWCMDAQSCELLWETELWWADKVEVCALWDDGSFLTLEEFQTLGLYTLGPDGALEEICTRVFPFWSGGNWVGDVVCNTSSDTFLLCGSSKTHVIRWMEGVGDDFVITEELTHTLSGNLLYLPKFCGVWASPSGENLFIMDSDGTGQTGNRQYIYRVSDGAVTEFTGKLPGMDPGFTSDETKLVSGNHLFDLATGTAEMLGKAESWMNVRSSDRIPGTPLLTVAYDSGTLCWWLDGAFAGQTTDPGYVPLESEEVIPGQNGLVAVRSESGWRVFDTGTKVWYQPEVQMDLTGPVCLGKTEKRIAFRTPEGDLLVYDVETAQSILWVPDMAVVTDAMYFVDGDTNILMLCANGTSSVASIYLGPEQTWEGFIYSPYYVDISRIQVREDAAGDEVYLFSSGGELKGWIYWDLLSDPKDFLQTVLGYLPGSNCLLCTDENGMQLTLQRRLELEDLVEMGEILLGK